MLSKSFVNHIHSCFISDFYTYRKLQLRTYYFEFYIQNDT